MITKYQMPTIELTALQFYREKTCKDVVSLNILSTLAVLLQVSQYKVGNNQELFSKAPKTKLNNVQYLTTRNVIVILPHPWDEDTG